MTRRLLIACGVAGTRGALVEGDAPVKFWFLPAQGDEARRRDAEDGDFCLARVKSVSKPLNGAFVDIGESVEAFMPLSKGEKAPVEGASMIVGVRRPRLGDKGAVVFADWRRGLAVPTQNEIEAQAKSSDAPRLLLSTVDPAVAVARKAAPLGAVEINVDRPEGEAALRRAGFDARIDARAIDDADLEGAIDAALAREVALPGGGRLVIDETEALTTVDVDSGAADAANGAVNKRAAAILFRELSRRAIGGRVVVDFLPQAGSPATRAAFAKSLREIDAELFPRRAGRLAPDGLFDLTAPRREISLLHRATEPAGAGWTREGRRPTLAWSGAAAVFALERELRRAPSSFPRILAASDLAAYLRRDARAIDALTSRYGARFAIDADEKKKERRFEIVSPQRRQ